jgi:L-lactate dehydrogenase complex protein LldG
MRLTGLTPVTQDTVRTFVERFKDQRGEVLFTRSWRETLGAIVTELRRRGVKGVAVASSGDERSDELVRELSGEFRVVPPGATAVEIESCDTGITFPVAAVAETGSIVEVSYMESDRLVSALPPIHMAHLKADAVFRDLLQIAGMIRSAARSRAFAVTLISGPSRTGDIELRLTLGVHGPHSTVLFLEV